MTYPSSLHFPDQADLIEIETGPLFIGPKQILGPISLTLSESRIGIIGRNGSGKTTFLRLIAGLLAPQSGQVLHGGTDLAKSRKEAIKRVGILFQNPDHQILFPLVEEELAFGLNQLGIPRKESLAQARTALAQEGRSHWAEAPISTLSGGQKQYVCLLSILLMAPQTILLDEPFASLDLPAKLRLQRRLKALPQRLITISHDPLAFEGIERVIWIDEGKVRVDGPATEVLPHYIAMMQQLGAQDADTQLAD